MIVNRGLQNSATTAAAAEEGNAGNEVSEEDRKLQQYEKHNNTTGVCIVVMGADMENVYGYITRYCTDTLWL